MVADMIVGFKGLRETFTSRVQKTRPSEIHVDYLEGPLKYLTNHWKFAPEPDGCAVDFCVDFAFRNRVFEMLAGQVFDRALRKMIVRKSVVWGKSVSVRVDFGGGRSIEKKKR